MKSRGCWILGQVCILVGGRGPRGQRPVRNAEYRDLRVLSKELGTDCIYIYIYTYVAIRGTSFTV
jgi:hypothetical protein